MAKLLWGKVFNADNFAGILQEETGNRTSFTYDSAYLKAGFPPIAYTLPVQSEPHISADGLLPFFDNLVAEGWVEQAQGRILGKRSFSRLELLLSFGFDCAGSVSVLDPDPSSLTNKFLDLNDHIEMSLLASRASLSGVQPKLAVIERNGKYYPTKANELSSYIAKFPSKGHQDLVINEYLTTRAFQGLLPSEKVVELHLGTVEGIEEKALIIKRFDRITKNGQTKKIHFEEFNQLLGFMSAWKYRAQYKDMADFILKVSGGKTTDLYRLYSRIVAGILLGNTDMHLKNFALFHEKNGFSMTPAYDQVASILYGYKTSALGIGGTEDLVLSDLKPKHLILLGQEFQLSPAAILMALRELEKNLEAAKEAITTGEVGSTGFKDELIQLMDKRWKGTYALVGQTLSKKR